jgi:hypothetical protein
MHRKEGNLNLSLKHRSEDSQLGSWPTSQAHTNNLKDKGHKIKTTNFLPIKSIKTNTKKSFHLEFCSPWEINSKQNEHKDGMTLSSMIIKL